MVCVSEFGAEHLQDCHLCPHRCGPLRLSGEGVCRIGATSYVASEMLHMGEEELLRPAHAIFFSGCTATCAFCTAAKFAFRPAYGIAPSAAQLAQRILMRQEQGARSICFVGGDPAPHIPFILETLARLGGRRQIPTVFNSNFYLTPEALALLDPAIDIWLPDLKFGPSSAELDCGATIGGMPDYWPVVTGCIDALYARGHRLIVRHLLMPGHFDCCTAPALAWLQARPGLQVSLLTQYTPPAHVRGVLSQEVAHSDIKCARDLARRYRLALVG